MHVLRASAAIAAAMLVSACGGVQDRDGGASRTAADATNAPPPRTVPAGSPGPERCRPPRARLHGTTVDPGRARLEADAAARRARHDGHRFAIDLAVSFPAPRTRRLPGAASTALQSLPALRHRVRVAGRRVPGGESAATLDLPLAPDAGLRVVEDRLYLQQPARVGAWRALGSASGVALDVGRELLDHDFLLETVSATRDGGRLEVEHVAPVGRLRQHATTERRGPVAELLAGARSLRITSIVEGGRLVGDRFVLVTILPSSLAGFVGGSGTVTVRGASSYCPLTPREHRPISAPTLDRSIRPRSPAVPLLR